MKAKYFCWQGLLNLYEILFIVGLGVVLALAIRLLLKGMLVNLGARLMLAIQRPFRVGDTIDAGGTTGRVEAVDLFNTILVTPDNTTIFIPHANVIGGSVSNFSAKGTRRIDMLFGIGNDQDLEAAKDIIAEVLSKDARILVEPSAQVDEAEAAGGSLFIIARPWVCADDYYAVRYDTIEQVKKLFDAEDVGMTYPRRKASSSVGHAQQLPGLVLPHGRNASSAGECVCGEEKC